MSRSDGELSEEDFKRLADFLRKYYQSDQYKSSQKYLRDLVHKNTTKRYTSDVPPTKEP